jgi:hypothetical protein
MPRALLALLIAFAVSSSAGHAVERMEGPKEMVLLTVGGNINNINRGPFNAEKDTMFARLDIGFDRAFAFDRPLLMRLKQGTVTAVTSELGKAATFTGPLLKEMLAAVGAARAKVSFIAINKYEAYLEPEDIEASDWILALEADGAPLGLGRQGPIWLINTRAPGDEPNQSHRGHWVWGVFFMRVGE